MKKITIIIVLCSIAGMAAAQKQVSNVRAQQRDTVLWVTYDLSTKADIEVYVSFDGGVMYTGPLKHVRGAVGKGIKPGKDRLFTWNIVQEFGYEDHPNTLVKVVAVESSPAPPVENIPEEKPKMVEESPAKKYPPFYLSFTGGISDFGTTSLGYVSPFKEGLGPGVFGADLAYFFNSWLGAGIKTHVGLCEVDFGEITYNETMLFVGPALYGRFGKGRFAFTIGAGGGWLNCKYEIISKYMYSESESCSSTGAFVSAGFNYMLSRYFGIGLNVQSVLGSLENYHSFHYYDFHYYDYNYTRNPAGIGVSLGINFRF